MLIWTISRPGKNVGATANLVYTAAQRNIYFDLLYKEGSWKEAQGFQYLGNLNTALLADKYRTSYVAEHATRLYHWQSRYLPAQTLKNSATPDP